MTEQLLKNIAEKAGKTTDEIKTMAETKRKQLNGMISEEGALAIIAQEFNLIVKNGMVIEDPTSNSIVIEDEEPVPVGGFSNDEELSLEDLGKKYIPSPKVGDEVQFVLKKIKKSKDIKAKTKEGKAFTTNLTSVDYKIVYVTKDDEEFTPKSWECVGKINAICKKLKKIEGVEISAKHTKDGMQVKEGDNWAIKTKINGSWKQLDRKTNDWKD